MLHGVVNYQTLNRLAAKLPKKSDNQNINNAEKLFSDSWGKLPMNKMKWFKWVALFEARCIITKTHCSTETGKAKLGSSKLSTIVHRVFWDYLNSARYTKDCVCTNSWKSISCQWRAQYVRMPTRLINRK